MTAVTLLLALMLVPPSVASRREDDVLVGPLRKAFWRFDRDGSGDVSVGELAVGILSSAESYPGPELPPVPTNHAFGEDQCADPTFDALSFIECAVARARAEQLTSRGARATNPVKFSNELESYIAGCQTSSWRDGSCRARCSVCAGMERMASIDTTDVAREPEPPRNRQQPLTGTNGTTILISSDWHVEPWYLSTSDTKDCGKNAKICRFAGANADNMFTCRDSKGKPSACNLDGHRDPPVQLMASHIASNAAAQATVLFNVGDNQAHSYIGDPVAVSKMQDKILPAVLSRFGRAENVLWTMGNNDGPHDAIFHKQDDKTVAWANAVLAHSIVTDDLGIQYSVSGKTMNQTTLFRQVGFYCKALPLISPAAYGIVMNTNLGGANKVQTAALAATLEWVNATHSARGDLDATAVYLLGHHPAVMSDGVQIVPEQYRGLMKGVFAGHVHFAKSTNSHLFTQVRILPVWVRYKHNRRYPPAALTQQPKPIQYTFCTRGF